MKNTVKLDSFYGNDLSIAMAAWTSTAAELTPERTARVREFVISLAQERHTVPFEHTYLNFQFHTDIATHIHVLKHRIGVSVSSQSFRWKEQETDGYIPDDWDIFAANELYKFQVEAFEKYHAMIDYLVSNGMTRKRAKESARYFLPYSTMLHYSVSMNFHSFAHFVGLRADQHAQMEIRELAKSMLHQVYKTGAFRAAIEGWNLKQYLDLDV